MQTDFTGPDGWYHFEDFAAGTYGIREAAQPACFIDGTETLGIVLPSGESRGTAGDDRFSGIVLNQGDHGIDYNFGELGLKASCINKTMLLGSSNLRQATVYEPLGIQSTVVSGTAGPDQINVRVEDDRIAVTVNGATTTIPRPTSQPIVVTVDAQAGVDTVSFQGTDDAEVAHVQPSYAAARNEGGDDGSAWDWAVEFLSAENLSAAGAAGDDLAVIRDSTGNDLLTANGDSATLDWLTDQEVSLLAFERVRALATRGGADKADVTNPLDFDLELLGDWTRV